MLPLKILLHHDCWLDPVLLSLPLKAPYYLIIHSEQMESQCCNTLYFLSLMVWETVKTLSIFWGDHQNSNPIMYLGDDWWVSKIDTTATWLDTNQLVHLFFQQGIPVHVWILLQWSKMINEEICMSCHYEVIMLCTKISRELNHLKTLFYHQNKCSWLLWSLQFLLLL